MSESKEQHKRIIFGPFEAHFWSQEIKNRGVRLRLPRQSFQILKMLLERPGELVTREELRQSLWPSDTFVDFDHGLNAAVRKLRGTLGDDADAPRYIETLPKRGYRFVGVIALPAPDLVPVAVSEEQREESSGKTNRRRLWRAGLGSAALCSLMVASFFWLRSPFSLPRVLSYRQLTTDRRAKGQPCGGASSSRVVTDGARVFFSENGYGLMQVSASGGEVVPVSNPLACFEVFDISPDKTELLGASVTDPTSGDNPLSALSPGSGLAHRIGNLYGHAAAWSPDGQRIAYATGSNWGPPNDLHIASTDGSELRKLAHIESGVIANILWSSDEKVLRIGVAIEAPKNSVWEVSSDGANLHLVRQLPEASCCFFGMNWTPDGKYLLAQVGPAIWALRESQPIFRSKASEEIQLTSGPINYQNPTLSPNGKKIFAIGGRPRGELLRYDLKSLRLEPYLAGISAEHLDFSRDGKWVTYVTFPEGILWRSRVDGTERLQLTAPPLYAVLPRWSPDRARIAFTGWVPGGDAKLYMISAEGGNPEFISQSQNLQDVDVGPTWTPDGNSLVFGGSSFDAQSKISSVDLRTRRVSIIPGSEGMSGPLISPDGRFIYAGKTGGRNFLFDQQTKKWSEVAKRASGSAWPQWSSDSKYVYLGHDPELRAGSFHVYRLRVTDRKIEPVASVNVPEGLVGVWGGWMSTAPDGTPLLLRDLSIQEIYALDVDLP